MQYSWHNCPDETRSQVERFVAGCQSILGENLGGIYLHGSLAMGCFNPALSDLDVLVVATSALSKDQVRHFATLSLEHSNQPHPIEYSVVPSASWEYPTPYYYHYGEDWRERQTASLMDAVWGELQNPLPTDPDLAAHFVIARERGVTLAGKPARELLPEVPSEDYIDSLLADFDFAVKRIQTDPVYGVLNLCRVNWYLARGAICSKDEAGVWAQSYLPETYQGVVTRALRVYRGAAKPVFDEGELRAFAAYIDEQIRGLLS